jgi:hypothetical protein
MRTWQRFRALNAADRGLLVEAAAWLAGARLGLSLLPFLTLQRTLASLSHRFARPATLSSVPTARTAWAITAAARHLPLRTTCLVESLAARAMLQRRGIDCALRLGVRRAADLSPFTAHAWLEHQGAVVLGQVDDLSEYARLQ